MKFNREIQREWMPDNIKEGYHRQMLSQSKVAFVLSIFGSVAGFVVILWGIYYCVINQGSQWVGIISGSIIEAVSILFNKISVESNKKISEFFFELTEDSNVRRGLELIPKIKDDSTRDKLIAEMAIQLLDGANKNKYE